MSFVPGQLTHAEGLDYGPITVSGGGSCPLWSAGNYFVELYASFSPPVPPSLPVPRGSDSTARQRLMAASSFIATLATIVIAPTLPFACTLSSACVLFFSSFLLTRPILIFDWKGRSPTPPSPPPPPPLPPGPCLAEVLLSDMRQHECCHASSFRGIRAVSIACCHWPKKTG